MKKKLKKIIIITAIIIVIILLIVFVVIPLIFGNRIKGLTYGGDFKLSDSRVMATIKPSEKYSGYYDSRTYSVNYKGHTCNINIICYEESGGYNLEQEKTHNRMKPISINKYGWYTNNDNTYLATQKGKYIYTVSLDELCETFNKKFIKTLKIR